jgi:anti-anti-sigma factor
MRVQFAPDAEVPGALLVTVNGSLDTPGSEKFMAEMATRVIPDCPSLILDLRGVEWVSSAGVGALVRLLTRTQSSGGTMALYGCGSKVQSVLRICGLESALNLCETASQARARLSPTSG